MITIDGSFGEGGGQILRTALGLSLVTGKPFRIEKIRAGRARPGLLRQHLTAVQAAARIGGGGADGASIGSTELRFTPGKVTPGNYSFAVGSAGSATLVLQTVLPALMTASAPSTLGLEGGTHNPWAPPFDFLQKSFLPLLGRMGPKVTATLERRGFYPAGSGRFTVSIEPAARLARLELPERGPIRSKRATAIVASLPADIAQRELKVVLGKLEIERAQSRVVEDGDSLGPGNVVLVEIEAEHVTEVVTGFGESRLRAEVVAERAVDEAREYLAAGAPVGPHLADQLLIPLALAGGGFFRTMALTQHATTNIEVIRMFLDARIEVVRESEAIWGVTFG
ncbi:MAG TPA: RNA 3'-terminal phosphate cyclase [Planctomycetota bacterium]|nr:RNA 3'-terminal phosphate cyclase [Planctomycetota bacterium]